MSVLTMIGLGMFTLALVALCRRPALRTHRIVLALFVVAGAIAAGAALLASRHASSQALKAAERGQRAMCLGIAGQLDALSHVAAGFDENVACRARTSTCAMKVFADGINVVTSATTQTCVDLDVGPSCDVISVARVFSGSDLQRALGELVRMHETGSCGQ